MRNFLLIDDHYVVRSGIKAMLVGMFINCVVDEAADADAATELLKSKTYDLLVMDIQIPNSNMLGLMEYINTRYPATKVLMFSMSPENIYAKRFLKAGAMGFLAKDASPAEISKAIEMVLNKRRYISPELADMLAHDAIADTPGNPFNRLSAREFEIATLLLAGNGLSEIAKLLHLQVSTVGTHKSRLFEKLEVENLLQLKDLAAHYNL